MLYILTVLFFADQCRIKNESRLGKSFSNIVKPVKGLAKKFGVKTMSEFPEKTKPTFHDVYPYFAGRSGFAILVAILVLLCVLFFVVAQVVSYLPSMKPMFFQLPSSAHTIVHIISCLVWLFSVFMCLVAAVKFTINIDSIDYIPADLTSTVSDIYSEVDKTLDNSYDFINLTLEDATNMFNKFIVYFNSTIKLATETVITLSGALNATAPSAIKIINCALLLESNLEEQCDSPPDLNLISGADIINSTLDQITQNINAFMRSIGPINQVADDIKDSAENISSHITDDVNTFKNTQIVDLKRSMHSYTDDITSHSDDFSKMINYTKIFGNGMLYSIISIMFVLCFMFFWVHFSTSKSAICLAGLFPTFGIIITLVFGIPAIIFAASFYILHDFCPIMEKELAKTFNKGDFENILLCPDTLKDNSLYDMGDFESVFDYRASIEALRTDLNGKLKNVVPDPSLYSNLLLSSSIDVNQLESINLIYGFISDVKSKLDASRIDGSCPKMTSEQLAENQKVIAEANATISTITQNLGLFLSKIPIAVDISTTLPIVISNTTNSTYDLIETFIRGAEKIIDKGVDNLTCKRICRIYAPVKNAICFSLPQSMIYWILSTFLLLISMISLSIGFIKRRKNMQAIQVTYDDFSEFMGGGKYTVVDKEETNYDSSATLVIREITRNKYESSDAVENKQQYTPIT